VTAPRRAARARDGFGAAVCASRNLPMACTVSGLPCGSVPTSPENTGDSSLRPSQTTIVALGYPSPSISTRSCL
jgi:hypothetical protein